MFRTWRWPYSSVVMGTHQQMQGSRNADKCSSSSSLHVPSKKESSHDALFLPSVAAQHVEDPNSSSQTFSIYINELMHAFESIHSHLCLHLHLHLGIYTFKQL